VLAARVALEDGGRRVVLAPAAPLASGGRYAAILAPGVQTADGRTLLDGDGKQRAVTTEFEVGPGTEPVRAALTEILADAATPESGGEFVEVANLGAAPLDLTGLRLAKHGASGTVTRCTIAPRTGGPVAPGRAALVAGGAYDGRYRLPAGTAVYQCGTAALLGGIANDRAPAIALEEAGGALSTLGVVAAAPRCATGSLQRLDAAGPDDASNVACPGTLTPGELP
jgi:hypothetical protein